LVARPKISYVGGWPMMEPLGKKEATNTKQHLVPGETVIGQVIGNFGQAVIATNLKFLVVKTGLMAGQTFGAKVTAFDYRNVVGVEVRTGLVQGEFEILSGGLVNNQRNGTGAKVSMAEQPNGVVFGKVDAAAFNAMASKIREMATAAAHASSTAPVAPASVDPVEAIKKLSELYAAGILTDAEFSEKKKELLGRM
jgi:Short C-terminal domain